MPPGFSQSPQGDLPEQVALLQTALSDRYVFERELGRGGMAVVYLAADVQNHRKVAVKVLRPELTAAVSRVRFEREISIVAHLQHPHILPLYDSGVVGTTSFFVMPYVRGETLRARLDREGQLPIEEALRLACEVADALSYAHAQSVIHRDIKPQNIMLESGHAVVADFGIALVADDVPGVRLTQTGFSLGSPYYMSPEQATATRRLDGRTDIYSLGCVLYEMLAGTPPFTGANVYAILARHAAEGPPSIRVVRQTVSEFLESVTFQAMAKVPADRYATAQDFMAALTEVTHERVRQTGPGRTTIPPRESAAGNGGQTAGTGIDHAADRASLTDETATHGDGWVRLARYTLMGALAIGAAAAFLFVLGFLSTSIYDSRLQVPAEFTPSRTDFLIVGAQALVPFFFFAGVGFALFFVAKYLLRLATAGGAKLPWLGSGIARAEARRRNWWTRVLSSAEPKAAFDALFAVALLTSLAILIRSWSLFVPLFTSETEALSCANRAAHWSFSLISIYFIAGLTFVWVQLSTWGRKRLSGGAGYGFARWATVALILLLLVIRAVPYRIIYETESDRVRVDGQPGYIVASLDGRIAVFDPVTQRSLSYAADDPSIEPLGVKGYTFEEVVAFESGRSACLAVTNP